MRLFNIILFILLCLSCSKRVSVSNSKHVTNQTDSVNTLVNKNTNVFDSVYNKPASKLGITLSVETDSTGIKPFSATIINGDDTLNIKGSGKQINARSNCEKAISRLRKELSEKDSIINAKNDSKEVKTEVQIVKETITEEVIPFYIWLLIGAMAAVILYLLIIKK